MKIITIFTNDIWKTGLIEEIGEEHPEWSEDSVYDEASDMLTSMLIDEEVNLDKGLENKIVVFGTLGLWNGRPRAGKILKSKNLNAILYVGNYDTDVIVNDEGDVEIDDTHHDGVNCFIARMAKPGMESEDIEEMLQAYVHNEISREDVINNTVSLGKMVCEIYGCKWEGK